MKSAAHRWWMVFVWGWLLAAMPTICLGDHYHFHFEYDGPWEWDELEMTETSGGTIGSGLWYRKIGTARVTGYVGSVTNLEIPQVIEWEWTVTSSEGILSSYYYHATIVGIGPKAFANRTDLESVVIPDTVTSIGESAFSNCTALTSITIPDAVTNIGASAFCDCRKAFSSLTLGPQVTSLGKSAFAGCTQLTNVVLDCPVTLPANLFAKCYGLVTVELGDNVKGLGNTESSHPFYYCSRIKSFRIGRGVTSIPNSYFSNPTPLHDGGAYFPSYATVEKIDLPDTLTSIEGSAFAACSNLTAMTIPDAVTNIGASAFCDCRKAFSSLTLGPQVTSLGKSAFAGCTQLTNVVLDCPVTLPANLFARCYGLVVVELGDNVKGLGNTLGDHPFYHCSRIKSFRIGRGVTSIPNSYFSNTTPLHEGGAYFPSYATVEKIDLPDTLTSIEGSAFAACSNLTAMAIPGAVTNIGASAFSNCKRLKKVTYSGNAPTTGSGIYSGTPAALTGWVRQGSTGWDGNAESAALPETWQGRPIRRWGTAEYGAAGEAVPGTRTETGGVPLVWLDEHDLARDGDYEAAAAADAANGRPVWECYVAGLDPDDSEAEFKVRLWFEDGTVRLAWNPDWSDAEAGAKRTYRLMGKKSMDEKWEDVPEAADLAAEGWQFFRVGVALPPE